jgi:tetratricopeptide (TPR) repeat protein
MTRPVHAFPFPALSRRAVLLFAAAAFTALPAAAFAADDNPDQNPAELSEDVSDAFGKLKPLIDARDWDGALALLTDLQAKEGADSYDRVVTLDTAAKIYFQGKDDPKRAAERWAELMGILDRYPKFMSHKDTLEHLQYLAQCYYMVGADAKLKDAEAKREYMDKSMGYMKRWLDLTPKARSNDILFYTTLLYYKAIANPEKIDKVVLKQAQDEAELGLLSRTHPEEQFYQLLIVMYQQLGEYQQAADMLEFVVTKKPSKEYFLELMAIYNNLASSAEKDEKTQRGYYARAINVIERAQKLGYLNTPKDNYNLVSMYNQVGQYGKAIELLHDGLKNGTIESTEKNWAILAYFYEQLDRDFDAIKILKEAAAMYPEAGEFDWQIANIYYQMDDTQNVYDYCKSAIAKDHISAKPYQIYQLFAYTAFSLNKYDEALQACEMALKSPGAPEQELTRLHQGIEEAVQQAALQKAAIEGKSL